MKVLCLLLGCLVRADNNADKHIQHAKVADEEEELEVDGPPPIVVCYGLSVGADCTPRSNEL